MNTLFSDWRFGMRFLRRNPTWSAVALLTLAIGIGANTAMLSIVDAVLWRGFPYRDADRLVYINSELLDRRVNVGASVTKFNMLREQTKSLAGVAGFSQRTFRLSGMGEPRQVHGLRMSANLFSILGVPPLLGRSFSPAEDSRGGSPVAVISYGFWQRQMGGRSDVLGQTITIDAQPQAIVGVLPQSFRFSFDQNEPEVFLPRLWEIPTLTQAQIWGGAGYLYYIGRLAPGSSLSDVSSELRVIDQRYGENFGSNADARNQALAVERFRDMVAGEVRPALHILVGAVLTLLLVACANVANLLLARGTERRKEVAIRLALGASVIRLLRQLFAEGVLLVLLGGSAGMVLGASLVGVAKAYGPSSIPRLAEATVDWHVLLIVAGLSFLTSIGFAVIPIRAVMHANVNEDLHSTRSSSGAPRNRTRDILAISEIAAALMLLICSGLLARSLVKMRAVDPGFRAAGVLTAQINLPNETYTNPSKKIAFFRRLLERAQSLPGVDSAGAVDYLPLASPGLAVFVFTDESPSRGAGRDPAAYLRHITPGYFPAMELPLVRGRQFTESDNETSEPVAILNETAARTLFPNVDPIGKHIGTIRGQQRMLRIVGIAANAKYRGLTGGPHPDLYVPYWQAPWPAMALTLRTDSDPRALAAPLREIIHDIDPDEPLNQVRTMQDVVSDSISEPRFHTWLLGAFSVIAFFLSGIGVYGVLSYWTAQRRHEIGIRMALGAQVRDVVALILGHGLRLTVLGVSAGLLLAFAAARALKSLLFGVTVGDTLTYLVAAAVLFGVAMVASYLPARRGARIDPLVALREL